MHKYLFLLLLSIPLGLLAQNKELSNEGTLYVSPETLLTTESHFINLASGKFINDGEVLLRRNFHNDGVVSFTPGEKGYTRFQGSELQEISGGSMSDFYDVLFDNQYADYSFMLSGQMSVFGQADFYRGIIDNYNYDGSITFEQDAVHIATSDKSYVEGKVSKLGSNSFIFPTGKQKMYRPAGVILLEETPVNYTGVYQDYNSNSEFSHDKRSLDILDINDQEFWTLADPVSKQPVLVNLSWDERTTPLSLLEDYKSLVVVAWDETANKWISLGGAVDAESKTVISIVEGQRFKTFTLGKARVVPEGDDFIIYNAVNPNDPGGNDYFKIVGIDKFPKNRVRIFNRWGVLVFDQTQYDTKNNVFRGFSDGRSTIRQSEGLPVGNYFYILDYVVPQTSESKSIQGYLYLNR